MKLKSLAIAGAALAMMAGMAACDNNEKGGSQYSLSDVKNATEGDSLMYYFGQLRASEYNQRAMSDTTLANEKAHKDFMRGMRAGYEAVREGEAYNLGVFQGVQLAMNLQEFGKEYPDTKLNKEILFKSMTEAMGLDSLDVRDAQQQFYAIVGRMEARKEAKDREAALTALPAAAAKLGLPKISDSLYGKVISEGSGAKIANGMKVGINASITDDAGNVIPLPLPKEVEVGARYVTPTLNEALLTMKVGGESRFATAAFTLFGKRAERLNLKPEQIVLINVKTSEPGASSAAAPAPSANPAAPQTAPVRPAPAK